MSEFGVAQSHSKCTHNACYAGVGSVSSQEQRLGAPEGDSDHRNEFAETHKSLFRLVEAKWALLQALRETNRQQEVVATMDLLRRGAKQWTSLAQPGRRICKVNMHLGNLVWHAERMVDYVGTLEDKSVLNFRRVNSMLLCRLNKLQWLVEAFVNDSPTRSRRGCNWLSIHIHLMNALYYFFNRVVDDEQQQWLLGIWRERYQGKTIEQEELMRVADTFGFEAGSVVSKNLINRAVEVGLCRYRFYQSAVLASEYCSTAAPVLVLNDGGLWTCDLYYFYRWQIFRDGELLLSNGQVTRRIVGYDYWGDTEFPKLGEPMPVACGDELVMVMHRGWAPRTEACSFDQIRCGMRMYRNLGTHGGSSLVADLDNMLLKLVRAILAQPGAVAWEMFDSSIRQHPLLREVVAISRKRPKGYMVAAEISRQCYGVEDPMTLALRARSTIKAKLHNDLIFRAKGVRVSAKASSSCRKGVMEVTHTVKPNWASWGEELLSFRVRYNGVSREFPTFRECMQFISDKKDVLGTPGLPHVLADYYGTVRAGVLKMLRSTYRRLPKGYDTLIVEAPYGTVELPYVPVHVCETWVNEGDWHVCRSCGRYTKGSSDMQNWPPGLAKCAMLNLFRAEQAQRQILSSGSGPSQAKLT